MHRFDADATRLAELTERYVRDRLAGAPALGRTATPAALAEALAGTLTPAGLGVDEAWRRFVEVVVPNTVRLDHPGFLALIPAAPTVTSALFDAVVGASSFSAESWLEAAGAVAAENQALALLADALGLPPGTGGCFVSGGSAGNLSALAVARDERAGAGRRVVVADTAHASVAHSLHLLGLEAVVVPTGGDGRLRASDVAALAPEGVGVVVASAGSTNAGVIDDLDGLATLCASRGWWFHVDGAYGAAVAFVPAGRERLAGIEAADSVIVDPHKWLFSPLDCCALLYREPAAARRVHTQAASYLDALHVEGAWNPADHAYHLTRRARGLPFWFSLAVHGTDAYAAAVDAGCGLARYAAAAVRRAGPPAELVLEPELSVVLVRRHGWGEPEWLGWSRQLLADGVAFVTPTRWKGEPVGRLVFLHPGTDPAIVDEVVRRLVC